MEVTALSIVTRVAAIDTVRAAAASL